LWLTFRGDFTTSVSETEVKTAATNYYTSAQMDAMLASIARNTNSGSPLLAGTNTYIAVVGGSNQVNVPFGIFDTNGAAVAASQAATNNALVQLATFNGVGMTNMPFFKTMTISGGSVGYSVNADGSTNVALTNLNIPPSVWTNNGNGQVYPQ
jgi:hypothetical protein